MHPELHEVGWHRRRHRCPSGNTCGCGDERGTPSLLCDRLARRKLDVTVRYSRIRRRCLDSRLNDALVTTPSQGHRQIGCTVDGDAWHTCRLGHDVLECWKGVANLVNSLFVCRGRAVYCGAHRFPEVCRSGRSIRQRITSKACCLVS